MSQYRVTFSRGTAARELWRFGEDEAAAAVLALADDDLVETWRAAGRLMDPGVPVPVEGRRVTNGHVICFACIQVTEGGLRPLARIRRRPTANMPEAITDACAERGPFVADPGHLHGDR